MSTSEGESEKAREAPAGDAADVEPDATETVTSRRRWQFSLRGLLRLAVVLLGCFWVLGILVQSGRDDVASARVLETAVVATVVSVAALPLVLVAHAFLYLFARIAAELIDNVQTNQRGVSVAATSPTNPSVPEPVPSGMATAYDQNWANGAAPTEDGPLYAGYYFDNESGLYHVRNRYYDAANQITTCVDGSGSGSTWYYSEEGNPYMYTGRRWDSWLGGMYYWL